MGPLPSLNMPFVSDFSMQDAGWAAYHLLGPPKAHGEGQVLCSCLGAGGCKGKLRWAVQTEPRLFLETWKGDYG